MGACGPHLLSLEVQGFDKSAVVHDAHRCTGCRLCEVRCPFDAITVGIDSATSPSARKAATFAQLLACEDDAAARGVAAP